jgi:hypothetical protein
MSEDSGKTRADVPTFVTVPPRVEIVIDERAAALEGNPHFRCLGHNHGDYFFLSKRSSQRMVTRDFADEFALALAPLNFWQEWSGDADGLPRLHIIDALTQLAQRTGQFKQQC